MMWFVLAGLLLARKAFSTAAQVAYTVHMVFNIKTVCLHYVILEMHSFPMSAAKHFYDNPLSIYLDPKIVLIYRPHPVHRHILRIIYVHGWYIKQPMHLLFIWWGTKWFWIVPPQNHFVPYHINNRCIGCFMYQPWTYNMRICMPVRHVTGEGKDYLRIIPRVVLVEIRA